MCRICTQVTPNEPQIVLGPERAFTYDYVFEVDATQSQIYQTCVERLVDGALCGYNATVLAYGQTGSGKTFTMGTGYEGNIIESQEGIIPRAIKNLFSSMKRLKENAFSVEAQYLEIYNEKIFDLLNPYKQSKAYKITVDTGGNISVPDATTKPLNGPQDAMKYLRQGALARTTASTQMNDQSSRSHAIFTIVIKRQRRISTQESGLPEDDFETLMAKFHFVDLAGSERLKRTGATGERAKEAISINSGLLSLGNVISALGDSSKQRRYIPYRDSKLTRLLQGSLGGNSRTLMMACVSPNQRDFMETLNTLKYASRARKITNQLVINQDQSSRTISLLRREIASMRLELLQYKQGKRTIDAEGNSTITDTCHENAMLLADNKRLQQRIQFMHETVTVVTNKNVELMTEREMHGLSEASTDKSINELIASKLIKIEKIETLLFETERKYQRIKTKAAQAARTKHVLAFGDTDEVGVGGVIDMAKWKLSGYAADGNNHSEENESGSGKDSDESKEKMLQEDLNYIEKGKLIEQLEMTNERMEKIRYNYEKKLNLLKSELTSTIRDRDQALENMIVLSTNTDDIAKKSQAVNVRIIDDMQKRMDRLQEEKNLQKKEISQLRREQLKQSNALETISKQNAVKDKKLIQCKEELRALKCGRK